jgi:N-methylhydantoinase B
MAYEMMQDWAGDGEYRGGPGVYVELVSDVKPGHPSFLMTGNSDGMVVAARGSTGDELKKLEMWIESPNGDSRVLRTMVTEPIYPDEILYTRAPGGGGWGDPLDRDPHKVQDDVAEGYISMERARQVYGVVIDPDTGEIKLEETEALRKEMRTEK